MTDMKKFLRYVVPGLVAVMEFVLMVGIFFCFNNSKMEALRSSINGIMGNGNGIGIALNLFLLSGGLGAVLSNIYHWLISTWPLSQFNFDYRPLLKSLANKNLVSLKYLDNGKNVDVNFLNRLGQWRILTAFWHLRMHTSKRLRAAERRSETLHDITHGLGASLVGSFTVLLGLVLVIMYNNISWLFISLPIVSFFIHLSAFRRAIWSIQSIMSNILMHEFYSCMHLPVILNVSKNDLRQYFKKCFSKCPND